MSGKRLSYGATPEMTRWASQNGAHWVLLLSQRRRFCRDSQPAAILLGHSLQLIRRMAVTISSMEHNTSANPNNQFRKQMLSSPTMNGHAAAAFTLGQISGFTQDLLQALPVAIYTSRSCAVGASSRTRTERVLRGLQALLARRRAVGALAERAFIPLVVSDKLIGKFMMYYEAPHVFDRAELDVAITIARHLGFNVERMRADQGSRLLAAIVETSNDAIVSKDLNGIVTSWNRGAEQTFGYTADEMIGRPIMTLIPPDCHGEEVQIIERIRRGEAVEQYETVRQRKDGTVVDISLTVSPVRDAAGKVVGASKIAHDISEKRRSQARQELLTKEIQHRTRNLFAVVLGLKKLRWQVHRRGC
jgi:PAS domain S-box-containing protein